MKKTLCTLLAALLLFSGCGDSDTPKDTGGETVVDFSAITLSDEILTPNRTLTLQYAGGHLYALIGGMGGVPGSYLVRYNCTTGRISTVCPDPLCFHENEDCPMICIVNWNILPNGRVCYAHRYRATHRNEAGTVTKQVNINDLALFDPASGKKKVLYEFDSSYFTGLELYTEDYRFYPGIEYDEKRELFVTGLYRMNLDNGDYTLLLEYASDGEGKSFAVTAEMFGIFGERIYLSDGESVFSIDFDGGDRVTHLEGTFPQQLHSDGEFVYYQKDGGIYRCNLSGGEEEHIVKCDNLSGKIILTTNWIYYEAGDEIVLGKADIDGYAAKEIILSGGEIYRCRHDGSEQTKIVTMSGEYEYMRPISMTPAGDSLYAVFNGWDDKNGDGIFTGDEQLTSGLGGEVLRIYKIDTANGAITPIDLK